jgi:hypothetical protein
VRPYLRNKLGIVMYVCNSSHMGGGGRKIWVQDWAKYVTISEKQPKHKKTAGHGSSGKVLA